MKTLYVALVRKPVDLEDLRYRTMSGGIQRERARITETVTMSGAEYDVFSSSFCGHGNGSREKAGWTTACSSRPRAVRRLSSTRRATTTQGMWLLHNTLDDSSKTDSPLPKKGALHFLCTEREVSGKTKTFMAG